MNKDKKRKRQLHARRRAEREAKGRKRWLAFRKERNRAKGGQVVRGRQRGTGKTFKAKVVFAPKHFSLFNNFVESNKFLSALESHCRTHRKVYLVLSDVETISIETILVLTATIKNHGARRKKKLGISGDSPRHGTQAAQMLYDSGFYEQFSSNFPSRPPNRQKGKMKQRRGYKVANEDASELALDANEAVFGVREYPLGVYSSLIEAMGNTREHANPEEESSERWWIMLFMETNDVASFIFYDAGIGILGSLRNRFTSWFGNLGIGSKDEDILHDIMHGQSRSRTTLPYRGKGLPAIAKAAQRKQIHNLRVLSNQVMADVNADRYERIAADFKGTLLYWEIAK